MKRIVLLLAMYIVLANVSNAQVVSIPDDNFRNCLINKLCVDTDGDGEHDADVDTNNDGEIQLSEVLAVERLDVAYEGILSMEGIEMFENLITLDCSSNKFEEFQLNDKPYLEELKIRSYYLSRVIVTGNPKLTKLSVSSLRALTYVDCSNNALTSFKLAKSAEWNEDYTIEKIDCSHNQIVDLQIDREIDVDTILCNNNLITNSTKDWASSGRARYIDMSSNKVEELYFSNNVFIDFRLNTLLYEDNPVRKIEMPIITNEVLYENDSLLEEIEIIRFLPDHLKDEQVSFVVRDLQNLNRLNLDFFNVDSIDVNLMNLNGDYTYVRAPRGNVVLDNVDWDGVANINSSKVHIINNDGIVEMLSGKVSTGNLQLENLPNLEHFERRVYGSGSIPRSGFVSFVNLPKLDTIIFTDQSYFDFRNHFVLSDLPSLELFRTTRLMGVNSVEFDNLPSLKTVDVNLKVDELSFRDLPKLDTTKLRYSSIRKLEFSDLPSFRYFSMNPRALDSLGFYDLESLNTVILNGGNYDHENAYLHFKRLPELEKVELVSPRFSSIFLQDLPKLKDFSSYVQSTVNLIPCDYSITDLGEISRLSLEGVHVDELFLSNIDRIDTLNLKNITRERNLDLVDLNVEVLFMKIKNNAYDKYIKLQNLPSLRRLVLNKPTRTPYIFNDLPNLSHVTVVHGGNLDDDKYLPTFEGFNKLDTLIYQSINSPTISLSGVEDLKHLELQSCDFRELDLADFSSLESLRLYKPWINGNEFVPTIEGLPKLKILDIEKTIGIPGRVDLSQFKDLRHLFVSNLVFPEPIYYLNLKNGSSEMEYFNIVEGVERVCVDSEEEADNLKGLDSSLTETVFSTYCNFYPGNVAGVFSGKVSYTKDGLTCDDFSSSGLGVNLELSNGDGVYAKYSDIDNSYLLPYLEGDSLVRVTPYVVNDNYVFEPEFIEFVAGDNVEDINFCMQAINEGVDFEVNLMPYESAIPGFESEYHIQVTNIGTETSSGTLEFGYDTNVMEVLSANSDYEIQNDASLKFELSEVKPFETVEVVVTVLLNTPMDDMPLNGDEELQFTAEVLALDDDIDLVNNYAIVNQIVVNSYDPNDKTSMSSSAIYFDQLDSEIMYRIRFENLGTAAAKNVVVRDVIDTTLFDLTSVVPLRASHDYTMHINDNVLEFVFEDIYLPYVDHSNDGFLFFKILPKNDLQVGVDLINKAEIYFDFNYPVITNESIINIIDYTVVEDVSDKNDNNILYPNPLVNSMMLSLTDSYCKEFIQIEVYTATGEFLMDIKHIDSCSFELKGLTSGVYLVKLVLSSGEVVMQKLYLSN